jgi:hypothetical protein
MRTLIALLLTVFAVQSAELHLWNQSTGAVRVTLGGGSFVVPGGDSFLVPFYPSGTGVCEVVEWSTNWGPVALGFSAYTPERIGTFRVWVNEEGGIVQDESGSFYYWFFRGGASGALVGIAVWVMGWLRRLASGFAEAV